MIDLTSKDKKIIGLFEEYIDNLKEFNKYQGIKWKLLYEIRTNTDLLFDKYQVTMSNKYEDVFTVRYRMQDGTLSLIDLDDIKLIEDLFGATFEMLNRGEYSFRFYGVNMVNELEEEY